MARYFSREEIEQLRGQLASTAVRDTDFSEAQSVQKEDQVAIVQNGVNRLVRVGTLSKSLFPGLTIPINGNPMTITHNMDRYPSVTVAVNSTNAEKEEVEVDVTYIDRNTVRVGWDVEESIEGFVYIV